MIMMMMMTMIITPPAVIMMKMEIRTVKNTNKSNLVTTIIQTLK